LVAGQPYSQPNAPVSPQDKLQLEAIEKVYLGGTGLAPNQLLHEAMCSAIMGDRKCPRPVPFMAFVIQSMRSIASHEREKRARETADGSVEDPDHGSASVMFASPPSTPEESLLEREAVDVIKHFQNCFEGDEHERRRFSIGHELGHWHHHRGRILFCGPKDVENPDDGALNPERHADDLASDLLLPNYLLHPRLRKIRRVTLDVAREIGHDFSASVTATLIKVVQSNRFPLIVVCHSKKKRRWFRRADMVPGWWFPLDQLDRESFAADMLFNGGAEQSRPRKIGADAWFGFRNCDRFEVEEQSFLLPEDRILTILTLPEESIF
jgi:hypothetical protein